VPTDPVVCLDAVPPHALPQALPPAPPLTLTLPQTRRLLAAVLPLPRFDPAAALALVAYQQRHNLAAYSSHRKRTLQHLAEHAP